MRAICFIAILLLPLQALAAEPFARATVEDGGRIVPGQQVYVTVDVFAPDFFTSPPQFPLFDLPNALVTLPEERTQNLTQTIDGTQYSGIRQRYAVVPEAPGNYTLPAIAIEFGYSADGKVTRAVARTDPVSFSAQAAPGTSATFAARNVIVEQTFDRKPASLKAGDALVQTITITAEDTQAMMIPPLSASAVPGLERYAKMPKIEDGIPVDREPASRRTETYIYTTAAEGHFTIPAVEYRWLDIDHGEMKIAHLPAVEVVVAPAGAQTGIAPALAPASTPPFERRRLIALEIVALLGLAAVIWAARGLPAAIGRALSAGRARFKASRRYRLGRLRRVIATDDPAQVYAALQAWSRSEGFRTLKDWATIAHPNLPAAVESLEQALFSPRGGDFDRSRLAALAGVHGPPNSQKPTPYALPPLNPGNGSDSGNQVPAFTSR
jgi:hypothetical protein